MSNWQIFIEDYQSSPVDLLVSAINEKLKKKKNVEESKQDEKNIILKQHGLLSTNEIMPDDDGDDIKEKFTARD